MGVEQTGKIKVKGQPTTKCAIRVIVRPIQKHKQKSHEKSCDTFLGPSVIIKSRSPILLISNTIKAVINATIII